MPQTDDKNIWTAYAKTVKPLGKIKKIQKLLQKKEPLQFAEKKTRTPAKKQEAIIPAVQPAPVVFDKRTERRLRQGDVEIDARLDLHGMRQHEAHDALHDFIARQIKAGHRSLLIITGKGRGGEGVLRTSLAAWLEASPQARHILAIRPAAIRHGGMGAFYVLLKRWKD